MPNIYHFNVCQFLRNSDIYVSPNPLWLCGHKADEVVDMGSDFYVKHIPPEELDSILGLAARLHKFLMCQPENERHLFSASYDVLMVVLMANGNKSILMNHRVSPLDFDSVGTFGLLCYVSVSGNKCAGNIEIRRKGQSEYWRYDNELDRWMPIPGIELTKGEKELLFMSAPGMTIDYIAKNICRSTDTIKSRRKAIFDKLNVRNMNEVITFATNYKLI